MKTPLTTEDVRRYFLDGVYLNEGMLSENPERIEAFNAWLSDFEDTAYQMGRSDALARF